MPMYSYARPANAATASLSPRQVALAYNYPVAQYDGTGCTVGIIELGGAHRASDLTTFCKKNGLPVPTVTSVLVDGATEVADPQGADGEVALDIQVVAAVAPGATIRVYFAPNTDLGFLHAIQQAAKECQVVSISWGGPENSWSPATLDSFDQAFAVARQAGVAVTAAAGDNGSGDGTSGTVVDFPSSSPHVVGCGGTRLTLGANGSRDTETVWNDSTSSATGGGVSKHFPGRDVPDVAGNADPQSGYEVVINGQWQVIGGTSAVAPLYAGLLALFHQAAGAPDLLKVVPANPTVCFDVTSGSNGAFRAGPGRDEATGFGVVDGEKLAAVLSGTTVVVGPPPPPPPPPPAKDPVFALWLSVVETSYRQWLVHPIRGKKQFAAAVAAWRAAAD